MMMTRIAHFFVSNRFAPIIALLLAVGLFIAPAARAAEPADLLRKAAIGSPATVDHSAWDRLLKQYVKTGADGINRVDYAAFKAGGQSQLKQYIRGLEASDPARLDRPEQFALLANLYNAKTVDIVLDRYPVASIKDISLGGSLFASLTGGPWKAKVLHLNGVELSLDDIEHGILRPVFKDPRVHYAVNCASIGCPNFRPKRSRAPGSNNNSRPRQRPMSIIRAARPLRKGTSSSRPSTIGSKLTSEPRTTM